MNYTSYSDNSLVIGFADADTSEYETALYRIRIAQLEAVLSAVGTQIDDALRHLEANAKDQRPQVASCYLRSAQRFIAASLSK